MPSIPAGHETHAEVSDRDFVNHSIVLLSGIILIYLLSAPVLFENCEGEETAEHTCSARIPLFVSEGDRRGAWGWDWLT